MTALQHLSDLKLTQLKERYPNEWQRWEWQAKFKDNKERDLEKCIIEYGKLVGYQCERIKVKPNRVDNRITYVDSVGFVKQIGRVTWTKSSMQAGSADLSLTIPKKIGEQIIGISVKCEIKIGKDTIKPAQIIYRDQIKAAGGEFWLVKSFQDFYDKYVQFVNNL